MLCIVTGLVMALIAGSCLPLIFLILGLVINEFSGYTLVTSTTTNSTTYFCNISELYPNYITSTQPDFLLKDRVSILSYYCIAIAALLFISAFLSNVLWTISALKQTRRMRLAFLQAILRQDIGYYDVNPPLQLPSRLAE